MTALIPVPETMRAVIVRADPEDRLVRDDIDCLEPDWSIWLVEAAMEDRLVMALRSVQRHISHWTKHQLPPKFGRDAWEVMADVHILSALHHPEGPFGLGYRLKQVPEHVDVDARAMTLIWRGHYYHRDRRGVLMPLPGLGRAEAWPTADEFYRHRRLALNWVDHRDRCE